MALGIGVHVSVGMGEEVRDGTGVNVAVLVGSGNAVLVGVLAGGKVVTPVVLPPLFCIG